MAIETIDYERCVGCGNCVKSCGLDVLRMNPETKKPVIVYPQDCIQCSLCERYCPVDALYINLYKHAATNVNCG